MSERECPARCFFWGREQAQKICAEKIFYRKDLFSKFKGKSWREEQKPVSSSWQQQNWTCWSSPENPANNGLRIIKRPKPHLWATGYELNQSLQLWDTSYELEKSAASLETWDTWFRDLHRLVIVRSTVGTDHTIISRRRRNFVVHSTKPVIGRIWTQPASSIWVLLRSQNRLYDFLMMVSL